MAARPEKMTALTIDLMRDPQAVMPISPESEEATHLRIWHCGYKTLKPLSGFSKLRSLVIGTVPDSSLEWLANLSQLLYLRIVHLPKVKDLQPISRLKHLNTLCLETSPAWDAKSRRQFVESLAPICTLPALEHVQIFGVMDSTRSLDCLTRCPSLRTARFSGYDSVEVERFFSATGVENAYAPGEWSSV